MASDRVFVRATHPHDPTQEWPTFPSAHPLPILNPLATPRHPAHPPPCTSAHCQGGQQSPLRPAAHRLLNSHSRSQLSHSLSCVLTLCLPPPPSSLPPLHRRRDPPTPLKHHHRRASPPQKRSPTANTEYDFPCESGATAMALILIGSCTADIMQFTRHSSKIARVNKVQKFSQCSSHLLCG